MNVQGFFAFFCVSNHTSTLMTQIWLPHCKNEPNSHYFKWAYRPSIFAHICQITANWNSSFTHYCQICSRNKYALQIYIYNGCMEFTHTHKLYIYISCVLTAFNNVPRSTSTHIFHITDMPLNNIPVRLQKYTPLHFSCHLYIDTHFYTHLSKLNTLQHFT